MRTTHSPEPERAHPGWPGVGSKRRPSTFQLGSGRGPHRPLARRRWIRRCCWQSVGLRGRCDDVRQASRFAARAHDLGAGDVDRSVGTVPHVDQGVLAGAGVGGHQLVTLLRRFPLSVAPLRYADLGEPLYCNQHKGHGGPLISLGLSPTITAAHKPHLGAFAGALLATYESRLLDRLIVW